MVPKLTLSDIIKMLGFRAVLFRMVPKHFYLNSWVVAVLELCCFEWFQNPVLRQYLADKGFRAVLFRMVPKHKYVLLSKTVRFRAVLFRMVPKPVTNEEFW